MIDHDSLIDAGYRLAYTPEGDPYYINAPPGQGLCVGCGEWVYADEIARRFGLCDSCRYWHELVRRDPDARESAPKRIVFIWDAHALP